MPNRDDLRSFFQVALGVWCLLLFVRSFKGDLSNQREPPPKGGFLFAPGNAPDLGPYSFVLTFVDRRRGRRGHP